MVEQLLADGEAFEAVVRIVTSWEFILPCGPRSCDSEEAIKPRTWEEGAPTGHSSLDQGPQRRCASIPPPHASQTMLSSSQSSLLSGLPGECTVVLRGGLRPFMKVR